MEFLQRIQQYTPVISDRDRLGMGGFFRTTKSDGKLIGSFLSNYPEQLRALLQQNPYLKIVSVEEMTPQGFIEYDQSVQESL